MELHSTSDHSDTDTTAGAICCESFHVEAVDIENLSRTELLSRLNEIDRVMSQITIMKLKALAEICRRRGKEFAEQVACDAMQYSRREAKRDVERAMQLAALRPAREHTAGIERCCLIWAAAQSDTTSVDTCSGSDSGSR